MIPGSEGPTTAEPAQDSSDDTIELELTGQQRRALSEALEAGVATARPDKSALRSAPEYETFASRRAARIDFICNVTCAVAVLAIAGVFLWPASARHRPVPAAINTAPLVRVTEAAPTVPPAAGPTEPRGAPIRIKNAFDATEVFEFPPGTAKSEARQAVAELLLSRARDRRDAGPTPRRAGNRQPNRRPAVQPPEAFVTKLVARGKEPLNGAN
jgi:hypothetical protein